MALNKAEEFRAEKTIEGVIRLRRLSSKSKKPWGEEVADAILEISERGDALYQRMIKQASDPNVVCVVEPDYVLQLCNLLSDARYALSRDDGKIREWLLMAPDIATPIAMLKNGAHDALVPYAALERLGAERILATATAAGLPSAKLRVCADSHVPHTDVVAKAFADREYDVPVAYMPTVVLERR